MRLSLRSGGLRSGEVDVLHGSVRVLAFLGRIEFATEPCRMRPVGACIRIGWGRGRIFLGVRHVDSNSRTSLGERFVGQKSIEYCSFVCVDGFRDEPGLVTNSL